MIEREKINIPWKFAQKVFKVCGNREVFLEFIKFLLEKNCIKAVWYRDYIIGKKWVIVYLKPTLMQWGDINITDYTDNKFNNLLKAWYELVY